MAGPAPERTVRVRVEGLVQGVGYRAWAAAAARGLDLRGWVRNRRDGSVEALFSGPEDAVAAMLAACGEGPPAARVSAVQVLAEEGEAPPGFQVLRTG